MDWRILLLITGAVLLGGVAVLALFSFLAKRPANLGVHDGKLTPCPSSPNCVCTQAADLAHRVEPIPFTGGAAQAHARLKAILAAQPRCRIVSDSGT